MSHTDLYAILAGLGLKGPPLTMDGLAAVIAKASPKPGTLTFGQAERVGAALHDRWEKMTGEAPPMSAESLAWADLAQFVIRAAREVATGTCAQLGRDIQNAMTMTLEEWEPQISSPSPSTPAKD